MEAPYYGVPTINIGDRQKNRLNSNRLINIEFKKKIILKAINFVKNNKVTKNNFLVLEKLLKKLIKSLHQKNSGILNYKKIL